MKKLFSFITLCTLTLAASFIMGGGISYAIGKPNLTFEISFTILAASMFAATFTKTKKGYAFATPFTVGLCEAIQTSLIGLLGNNSPELKRTQVGYLQAVVSPQNTAGVTMVPVDPGNGKFKQVRITYIQRGCSDDVVLTCADGSCDAEVFKSPLETLVEVTDCISTKWMGFNESDMRKLCEPDGTYRARVMNSQIDVLMVELDKALIALQNANFGNFPPTNLPAAYDSCKDVILLNTCENGISYAGEAEIIEDFKLLDTTSRPILIGAGRLSRYVTMAKVGCCNDTGINTSQAGAFDFFHDRYVEGIIGANGFIGLVPGYVQLLTWNQFVGDYRKENDTFSHGTITDPLTGITLDQEWIYDPCTYQYKHRFKLHYELHFIPVDSFAACDELEGVNFTLCYTATASDC